MPRSRSGSEASDQSEDTPVSESVQSCEPVLLTGSQDNKPSNKAIIQVRRKGGRRSPSASKSRSRSSSGEEPGQTGETKVIKVSHLTTFQGSLLFSKIEFSIKPDLRDLSFS